MDILITIVVDEQIYLARARFTTKGETPTRYFLNLWIVIFRQLKKMSPNVADCTIVRVNSDLYRSELKSRVTRTNEFMLTDVYENKVLAMDVAVNCKTLTRNL